MMRRAVVIAALALLLLPAVRVGAVNPRLVAEGQRDAPESLVLNVTAARREPKTTGLSAWQQRSGVRVWNVFAEAEVLEVRRSATGLKPGAIIALAYESYEPVDEGGGPPPVLAVSQRCPAFLERTPGTATYRPVVGANSFQEITPATP